MKVLIACGGTGGHVFPAIALAQELQKKEIEILFLGTKRKMDSYVSQKGFKSVSLDITAISFSSIKKLLRSLLKLIKATLDSFSLLFKFKPDVAVGIGGSVSGPVMFAAYIMRIPTVIHEQNVKLGKANYILSKLVDNVAITFEQSRCYGAPKKSVLTGCPIRKELLQVDESKALDYFGFKKDAFTVFIMGGSQGSHKINKESLKAFSKFKAKSNLQVIHISGSSDFEIVKEEYKKIGINAETFEFFDKIEYAYRVSDLLIARAGASTISEAVAFNLPAVIIPYPFAGGHQLLNAKFLSDKGAAVLIKDSDLSEKSLLKYLEEFYSDRDSLRELEKSLKKISVLEADRLLSKLILEAGEVND